MRSPAVSDINVLSRCSWSSSLVMYFSPFYSIFLGPALMTPASLHGELLRRGGSCNLDSGSSLVGPSHIRPVLTASRRLDDWPCHRGFLSLIHLPVIRRHQQFRCWIDFPLMCLDFPLLWLGHFLPLLWFRMARLTLVAFLSSILGFRYLTLNRSIHIADLTNVTSVTGGTFRFSL